MAKIKIMVCSFFLSCVGGVYAQSGAVSSGGNASGTGGTVSYTVGLLSYTTIDDGSNVITQGIQQPYEILIVNGIKETGITLGSVYPNPTTDYVTLSLTRDFKNMNYSLSDMNGRLINQRNLITQQTNIPMASLANGAYLIKVYNDKTEIKTYKIIKNN